jgi:hypothetical protein
MAASSVTLDDVEVTAPAPQQTRGTQISPNDEILTILTGGQRLTGCLRSTVTRGPLLCPSHFEIELTERFPASQ